MKDFLSPVFARLAQAERETPRDELSRDVSYANETQDAEMTPYDIRSRRFGKRVVGGLDPEEVTAFLDEVAEALDAAQRLNIDMGARLRWLEDEVEALSNKEVSVAPSDAGQVAERQPISRIRENGQTDAAAAAASGLEVLRSTVLQEVEALLHDAQARAQALTDAATESASTILREADALKAHRQKEAEELMAEATVAAESVLTIARTQEAALRQELDLLAERRLRMFDDVRAMLNECHEWLATIDPRRRGPEERNVSPRSGHQSATVNGRLGESGMIRA